MQTVMFTETIFGPIRSRRLGTSLGVNLSPRDGKVCNFDCLYCEAGFNAQGPGKAGMPRRDEVARLLEEKLQALRQEGTKLDVITFSGNGEPTVNPDFPSIIDDTIALRDRYCPEARVSVLTNSTMLDRPAVVEALRRVDNCLLKLDSAIQSTVDALDRPTSARFDIDRVIDQIAAVGPDVIVQTMITRGGGSDGNAVDNTSDAEIEALIEAYRRIRPRQIMLYSIDRPTPDTTMRRVQAEELREIAARIEAATGIPTSAS